MHKVLLRDVLFQSDQEGLGRSVPLSGPRLAALRAALGKLPGAPISLHAREGRARLVTSDPLDLISVQNAQVVVGAPVSWSYASTTQLQSEESESGEVSVAEMLAGLTEEDLQALGHLDVSDDLGADALKDIARQAPVVRFVNATLAEAYRRRASDVHLDPAHDRVSLRFRIDGVLHEQPAPPKQLYPAIISRIKILAGLDIAEKRLPQDGRFRLHIGHNEIDLRVATAPSIHGESVALRLLDRRAGRLSLTELGLSDRDRERLESSFRKNHGIVLVTGPTGSGKTTTLYAALDVLRSADRKIVTLEDPIEYEIPGVTQIQVRPKIGLTFASGLRSILRHDPDIILVGEIRDRETAEMAVHASLTGHLVLSSLHTNDAVGALTRLIDMEVEPFLIASTVRAVVAQRLVRVLCGACKAPTGDPERPYRAVGCDECMDTGYRGRSAICEVLLCTPALTAMIGKTGDPNALYEVARADGMRSMHEDGMEKVRSGITTVDEVLRVGAAASK